MRKRRGGFGGGLWGGWVRLVSSVRVGSAGRVGTQADMFPVSSGAARSRNEGPRLWRGRVAAVDYGVQRRDESTLGKWIVMQSKGCGRIFGANGAFIHLNG
ncbi:hypothetical protein GCM10009646_24470 [Streptomyces aureus]